jgi:hypothetical protein
MNDAVRGETVADYKRLLQRVCDNRPSGTRGRLAVALGTNRSFVSQLVNPVYAMPIPAQHLETIFEVCHFSWPSARRFSPPTTKRIRAAAKPASRLREFGWSASPCPIWGMRGETRQSTP